MAQPPKQTGRGTRKRLHASQYNLVWFCSGIDEEVDAALASLDSRHDSPTLDVYRGAAHHYGEIKSRHGRQVHNVIVTQPSSPGKEGIARASAHINANFPGIEYAFFVGVGGGLPNPSKRLERGDVVISKRQGQSPAVLEYDYANFYDADKWEPKFVSDKPAPHLQSQCNAWYRDYLEGATDAQLFLDKLVRENPTFAAPAMKDDVYFLPDDQHIGPQDDCTRCVEKYKQRIRPRVGQRNAESGTYSINVHLGPIVTGSGVIRDAKMRENIRSQAWGTDALCVDMESSVLMDEFHPLIIRGISAYADSHYGYKWFRYAAATAAAVAKDMIMQLQHVPRQHPQQDGSLEFAGPSSLDHGKNSMVVDHRRGLLVAPQANLRGDDISFSQSQKANDDAHGNWRPSDDEAESQG